MRRCQVVGKRLELFAFIEVDDRRNTKTCHVFMCEKGVKNAALRICEAVCKAFEDAVEDAKKRAGNPLLPMDKVRDVVEGPLASLQVPRKDLVAIKAIGMLSNYPTNFVYECEVIVSLLSGQKSECLHSALSLSLSL